MPDQTPDDVRSPPFRYTQPIEIIARLRNPLKDIPEMMWNGSLARAHIDAADARRVRVAAADLIERQAQEIERAKQLLAQADQTCGMLVDSHSQTVETLMNDIARLREMVKGQSGADALTAEKHGEAVALSAGDLAARRIHELEAMNREQKNMLREQARTPAPEWAEPSWLPHLDALIKREHELSLRPEHPRFTLDVRRMVYEAQCPVTA